MADENMKSPVDQIRELEKSFDDLKKQYKQGGPSCSYLGDLVEFKVGERGSIHVEYRNGERHVLEINAPDIKVAVVVEGGVQGNPFALEFRVNDQVYTEIPVDRYEPCKKEDGGKLITSVWREGDKAICAITYKSQ